jgi:hypothetical protein
LENLNARCGVAEATGSGVAVWELSRKAHPTAVDPGWETSANWDSIGKIKDSSSP